MMNWKRLRTAVLGPPKVRPAIPPCPAPGSDDYLEWIVRYAPPMVAGCAAKALAIAAEERMREARLRQIIREELARDGQYSKDTDRPLHSADTHEIR